MQYASVWLRIVALLIDGFILSGIFVIIVIILAIIAAITRTNATTIGILIILILIALPIGYFIYMEATRGATLGKKALGLRIVKVDGRPIGSNEAILRSLLRIVDNGFLGGLIGFICILATEKQQRVGDMVAKTIVIKTR